MATTLPLLIAMPAVLLSAEHEAMCRVSVGDAFPTIEARDAAGAAVKLAEVRGEKATVVATTGGAAWMSEMLRGDLSNDFAPKYADRGVALVLLAAALPNDAGGVQALAVPDDRVAQALGEGRGPRIYVLDAAGQIVWFDLEYTLSTHRELHQALDELTGAEPSSN